MLHQESSEIALDVLIVAGSIDPAMVLGWDVARLESTVTIQGVFVACLPLVFCCNHLCDEWTTRRDLMFLCLFQGHAAAKFADKVVNTLLGFVVLGPSQTLM